MGDYLFNFSAYFKYIYAFALPVNMYDIAANISINIISNMPRTKNNILAIHAINIYNILKIGFIT